MPETMPDFYAASATGAPQDQADGLRRMFSGSQRRVLPLVANPHVPFCGVVLDRLAAVLAERGRQVLVVDAALHSPPAHELALLDLSACLERLSSRVSYLAARGLPMAHVDTRGCAGAFIDALQGAAPQAEIILLHAEAGDLARVLMHRSARPVLIAADHPESVKHAYATCKLLARRCGLMTFDLLLAAAPGSPRAPGIASTLAHCADGFLGALLQHWAQIDPAGELGDPPDEALARLLAAQLSLEEVPTRRASTLSAAAGSFGPTSNTHVFR
jgi:flagellar biosynthesis protein FlhG